MIKYAVNRAVATSFCAIAGVILVRFSMCDHGIIDEGCLLVPLLFWDILLVNHSTHHS